MTAISFFTNNGKYPALAERLRDSCQRFNVESVILEAKDRGDWLSNNNSKPDFILNQLISIRGPVLWMDVDTELLTVPHIPADADFGIVNWKSDPELCDRVGGYDPESLVSSGGVIYFDYTAPAIELLIRWCLACAANPTVVEDQVLDRVFNSPNRPPVKPVWMPKEMNWMTGLFGEPKGGCFIRHDFVNRKHYEI